MGLGSVGRLKGKERGEGNGRGKGGIENGSQKGRSFFLALYQNHIFFWLLLHTLNTLNTRGVCSSVQGKKDLGKGKGKAEI